MKLIDMGATTHSVAASAIKGVHDREMLPTDRSRALDYC